MLLVETNCFLLDSKNIISENRSKGSMVLRGKFQRCDEVNANNRIYRRPILEREIEKLQPLVKENRLLGELDHPESEVVRLSNASHMITGLSWEGNDVIGECTLLNTPAGLTAQTLVRDGVKVGISSRGLGTLSDLGESVKEVNDDYDMRTFDLVADPSTKGAFPGLIESKNFIAEGRAVVKNALKKAKSERTFVIGLKKALGESFETPKDIINEAFLAEDGRPKTAPTQRSGTPDQTPEQLRQARETGKVWKQMEADIKSKIYPQVGSPPKPGYSEEAKKEYRKMGKIPKGEITKTAQRSWRENQTLMAALSEITRLGTKKKSRWTATPHRGPEARVRDVTDAERKKVQRSYERSKLRQETDTKKITAADDKRMEGSDRPVGRRGGKSY